MNRINHSFTFLYSLRFVVPKSLVIAAGECDLKNITDFTHEVTRVKHNDNAILLQLQLLVAEAARELSFNLMIVVKKANNKVIHTYTLVDANQQNRLTMHYTESGRTSQVIRIVKYPKSVKQVNALTERIAKICKTEKEAGLFRSFLSRLVTRNENNFIFDVYSEDDDLSMVMESKTGFQQLEVEFT